MNKINGNGHGIDMTPDQVAKMIVLTEQEITDQAKELQPLAVARNDAKQKMEQAEEEYLNSRRVHDELARKMELNKELLQNLTNIKEGKKGGSFRLMRGSSHTDNNQKRATRISWTNTAIDILKKEDQFIKLDILVDKCINIHIDKLDSSKVKPAKYAMADNFRKSCDANKENSERRVFAEDRLMEWNNKIGLQSWFGPDNRPLIKYIKGFVYSDNGKESVPA